MNKKELEDYLREVNYSYLNSTEYKPTRFALEQMAYINLINGDEGEENVSPPMHLAMFDKYTKHNRIVNLLHRGSAKTTVNFETQLPVLALTRQLPLVGKLKGMLYISDSMDNGVASARKAIEARFNGSKFLRQTLKDVKIREKSIEIVNQSDELFTAKLYGVTSGIRGTKIGTERPKFCVIDDIISDKSAKSETTMEFIKAIVNGGLEYALHPSFNKIVWNGTPFDKRDVILQAIESGAWEVSVYPVCEKFPCTREEFRGSWEDRFPYEIVSRFYDKAKKEGQLSEFYKEMMLQISSDDERMIQDSDLKEYERGLILGAKQYYNFYITTDFATSTKQSADDTVISVWAVSSNGDYFWVDGICEKQTMDKTIKDLLRLAREYKPQTVGIEVNGQQYGFIPLIRQEMFRKQVFFNITEVRNSQDKLSRFNLVLPLFKGGKIFFPSDLRETPIMKTFMQELRYTTYKGIKGHDDCVDTISMLAQLDVWPPSYTPDLNNKDVERQNSYIWGNLAPDADDSPLDSYLV